LPDPEPMEPRDTIKLILDYQTARILGYISTYNKGLKEKNKEDRRGLTKDMVAKEMHDRDICSRLTTLKKLDQLLQREIILDKKVKAKSFSVLEINHDSYPWEFLALSIFASFVQEITESLHGITENKKIDEMIYGMQQFYNRFYEHVRITKKTERLAKKYFHIKTNN